MQKFQAIVFDFDGTLSDTPLNFVIMRANAIHAITALVEDHPHIAMYLEGKECSVLFPAMAPMEHGKKVPFLEELNRFCRLFPLELQQIIRQNALASIEHTEVSAASRARLFPGVRECLRLGRQKGVHFGIVTRNCRRAVLAAFPDIENFVGCVLTREDVAKVKPHPEHLLHALRLLGCPPEQALMVGDHIMDIEVGRNAGTKTAGVATGEASFSSLASEKPDYIAHSFYALMEQLGLCPN